MKDKLHEAAMAYLELMNVEYFLILVKNKKQYKLNIRFTDDGFYHLVGLQHIKDISFGTTNKSRIFKNVINKKITIRQITKSKFYSQSFISERISLIKYIEQLLDNSQTIFKILNYEYIKYTNIRADYLCSFIVDKIEAKSIYLFLRCIDRDQSEYRCCSLFKEHDIDYHRGTTKVTVLYVEKRIKGENKICTYKHPKFEYKDIR